MTDERGADPTVSLDATEPVRADANLSGVVAGRYALERQLGAGGMSLVFAARDSLLDRRVALKVIRGRADAVSDARLVREARAMARLSHPNVIQVFDVGVHEGGPVYIAMELVEGVTLDRFLREREPDAATIVELFREAGRGLAAAHAVGLVHRDFKPDNVMVGNDGRVRVLDFGLVRAADTVEPETPAREATAGDTALTSTGTLLGTPRYMSPEQWRGEATDARTDQFSFCVALAAALGGQHPFCDTSREELRDSVLAGARRELPASVPAWLVPTLQRGLATARDERFASMDELVRALAAPARRSRKRLVFAIAAGVIAASTAAAALVATRAGPPAPGHPFRCGPHFETYALIAPDAVGVRCVMFVEERNVVWYGETLRGGVHHRYLGEGELGGAATGAEFERHGEGGGRIDRDFALVPEDAGDRPMQIAVRGPRRERWLRTAGLHAGYTAGLTESIRGCGPQLTRYRVYPKFERHWGSNVRCVLPSGRTYLGGGQWARDRYLYVGTERADAAPFARQLCMPSFPCYPRHGRTAKFTKDERHYPGLGRGFDLGGSFPEVWLPSSRRFAIRIHAVRVVDDGAHAAPIAVADIERAVDRANALLAPLDLELLFVADERGPDVETVLASTLGDASARALADEHASKLVALFAASCPPEDPRAPTVCAKPGEDRLALAIARALGLGEIPTRALSPTELARVERALVERRFE